MYNYEEAMRHDILSYIGENDVDLSADTEELCEQLYDELWAEDSITGNGSENGYADANVLWEYLKDNRELFVEAATEFDSSLDVFATNPVAADATIRCYLLSQVICEIVEDLKKWGMGE